MKKIVTETVTTTTTIAEDEPLDPKQHLIDCMKSSGAGEATINAILDSGIESVRMLAEANIEDLMESGVKKAPARSLINLAKENFRGNNGVYVTGKDVSGNIVTGGVNYGNVDNSSVKVVKEKKMWSKTKY